MTFKHTIEQATEGKNKYVCMAQLAAAWVVACPIVGWAVNPIRQWESLTGKALPDEILSALALAVLTPALGAKIMYDFLSYGKMPKFRIGEMDLLLVDCYSNILITGGIGSGKTSSFGYPFFDQWTARFNRDDPATKTEKTGILGMDAKGEMYEVCMVILENNGRNILEDMVLVRPMQYYPIVKFKDLDSGHYLFLSATEFSQGSCVQRLLGKNMDNEIPTDIFSKNVATIRKHEESLKGRQLNADGLELFWVGWRKKGSVLKRITHSKSLKEWVYQKEGLTEIPVPKRVEYAGFELIGTDVRWNLVDDTVAATEAAKRLSTIAAKIDESSGKGGGGDGNAYFYQTAERFILNAIDYWRNIAHIVDENAPPCNGVHISKMATDPKFLKNCDKAAEKRLRDIEVDIEQEANESVRGDLRQTHERLMTVHNYFTQTWPKDIETKTRGIATTIIENAFKDYVSDPALAAVFCKDTTIDLRDIIQKGKIVFLVTVTGYEKLKKAVGTGIKLEVQRLILSRLRTPYFNKTRPILYIADEAQNFVSGDDADFLLEARAGKICNFLLTQGETNFESELGKTDADKLVQNFYFRGFLGNLDPRTNESASKILGKRKRAEVTRTSEDLSIDSIGGKHSNTLQTKTNWKEDQRTNFDSFANLNKHEAWLYNRGADTKWKKSIKCKMTPHWLGNDGDPARNHKILEVVARYYQAKVENILYERDRSWVLNPDRKAEVKVAKPPAANTTGTFIPPKAAEAPSVKPVQKSVGGDGPIQKPAPKPAFHIPGTQGQGKASSQKTPDQTPAPARRDDSDSNTKIEQKTSPDDLPSLDKKLASQVPPADQRNKHPMSKASMESVKQAQQDPARVFDSLHQSFLKAGFMGNTGASHPGRTAIANANTGPDELRESNSGILGSKGVASPNDPDAIAIPETVVVPENRTAEVRKKVKSFSDRLQKFQLDTQTSAKMEGPTQDLIQVNKDFLAELTGQKDETRST